jgi:hypothetical protein|nr:MAG TPA: helix-turn-helix domain protein [Caudoviricetes sp.]
MQKLDPKRTRRVNDQGMAPPPTHRKVKELSTKYLFPVLEITEGLTANEKLVLIALADMADDKGICWPAMKSLAGKSICSKRTAQRAIKNFEKMNLLTKYERPNDDKRNDSNLYQLHFMELLRMGNSELVGDTQSPSGRHTVTHRGDTQSPSGRHTVTQVGDTQSPEPINKEPIRGTYQEPIKGTRGAAADATGATTKLFDEFRAAYPTSRRGTEVKQARAQFAAAVKKVDDPQVIIAAAAKYATHCKVQGTEPKYIKSMWRWLRDERYLDEYAPGAGQFMSHASRVRAQMGVHSPFFPEATRTESQQQLEPAARPQEVLEVTAR